MARIGFVAARHRSIFVLVRTARGASWLAHADLYDPYSYWRTLPRARHLIRSGCAVADGVACCKCLASVVMSLRLNRRVCRVATSVPDRGAGRVSASSPNASRAAAIPFEGDEACALA